MLGLLSCKPKHRYKHIWSTKSVKVLVSPYEYIIRLCSLAPKVNKITGRGLKM